MVNFLFLVLLYYPLILISRFNSWLLHSLPYDLEKTVNFFECVSFSTCINVLGGVSERCL